MKKAILFLAIAFAACKKNDCQVCSKMIVGPDLSNPGAITHDTIYTDSKFCGDQLTSEQKDNGKYYETKVGSVTYRWTTQVHCH